MSDYLTEAIDKSGLSINKTAGRTPANKDFFDVDDGSPRLPKPSGDMFHSIVAKLLYVSVRATMDLLRRA